MNLNAEQLQEILKSIRGSLTSNHRSDDIALPICDPEWSDSGAETWCKNIESLGTELGWIGIQKAAKAGLGQRETMNLNAEQLQEILKSIRGSLTSNHRSDDIALPICDPEWSDSGAETWCKNIESLGIELGWIGIQKAAKAGKALRGSDLSWFETWEPEKDIALFFISRKEKLATTV